ncbi:fatty acid desaturase-domain-containing protein [Irpex lacteus]|nr:fatty acid desaturase-domain-containing protein [Irpex lacteus]
MFVDSPEYQARLARPFVPPRATLKQIHDAVPKHLLKKDPLRSFGYVARDVSLCVAMFTFAAYIDPISRSGCFGLIRAVQPWQIALLKTASWLFYWWWQSLVFTSFFCIAHELGHGTLFHSRYANDIPGFILDTFILLPYYAWQATHNIHHKAVGSIERDENYVPHLRDHYKLPPQERATRADYAEVFDETPAMTLFRMVVMQVFGWWCYLSRVRFNAMGPKSYPEGTNHFSPYSALYKPEQRLAVMISLLLAFGVKFGWLSLLMYYFIPYVLCNHWIVMCTFLHHSDPSIPHYRKAEWTFLRGVVATVDRPLLGWIGRFFFHNVSHDHIAHHFFSSAPFYNQPQITAAIRSVLNDDYNYDSTYGVQNSFYALYRSFTECVFVEEDGDIVFYKNGRGEVARYLAQDISQNPKGTEGKPEIYESSE